MAVRSAGVERATCRASPACKTALEVPVLDELSGKNAVLTARSTHGGRLHRSNRQSMPLELRILPAPHSDPLISARQQ